MTGDNERTDAVTDRAMTQWRSGRSYVPNVLPTMRTDDSAPKPQDEELRILLNLYETAVEGWRILTDVRFKLLAFVPALSILAWSQIIRDDVPRVGGFFVAVAGLAISVGLWIYDTRNNRLYNEMISRARRIESELGVDTGVFRGRPDPRNSFVKHGTATFIIYGTVIIGWVLVMISFIVLEP